MEFTIVLNDEERINIKGSLQRIHQEMFEDVCRFSTLSDRVLFVPKNKILYIIEKDNSKR